MARNYAAVPYEYLEEMEPLTDEEFGRLVRALLIYSRDGVEITGTGNEKFYAKRVMGREERFQTQFQKLSAQRSEAGRAGAEKRWNGREMAGQWQENSNPNPKTNSKTETKSNSKSNPSRGNPRRKGYAPAPPGEMEECLKKDMNWLKEWSEQMDAQGENASNITMDNGEFLA